MLLKPGWGRPKFFMISELVDRSVVFFGGKGGVGKTTMSTAFAFGCAKRGRKTLLVSTDPAHNLSDILCLPGAGAQDITPVDENFYVYEIDPEQETERYLSGIKDVLRSVVRPDMQSELFRQLDMAGESPGAKEAAIFDRLALLLSEKLRKREWTSVKSGNLFRGFDLFGRKRKGIPSRIDESPDKFDMIVFDTAPTGHTLHLLSLPESMRNWMDGLLKNRAKAEESRKVWVLDELETGAAIETKDDPVKESLERRRNRFATVRDILLDRKNTSFVFVTNPASLAVSETERAIGMLEKFRIPIGGVIVNGIIPENAILGSGESYEYLNSRMHSQQVHIERIKKIVKKLPVVGIDLCDTDIVGMSNIEKIEEALFRETSL